MHRSPSPSLARGTVLALFVAAGLAPPPARAAEAPPAGVPAAELGTIRVESPVPGAEVWVDHQPAGRAPVAVPVAAGEHVVRVAADGYDPFVRKVEAAAGAEVAVRATLLPGGGTVEFQVEAPGARLLIEGEEWPLPVRLRDLAPGEHRYRVEAPGHEPLEGSFVFEPRRNIFLALRLEPSAGRVSLRSTPPGARAWLDGRPVGATPVELEDVEAGVHSVLLRAEGRATVVRRLDTSDGSKGEVDARLPGQGARLVVRTGEESASVLLDDAPLGTGRRVVEPAVARGRYALRVEAPGLAPAEHPVDLPARGRSAWRARLGPERSELVELPPLTRRWTFWTAAGGGVAALAVGAWAVWAATRPEPVPGGDVVVVLP